MFVDKRRLFRKKTIRSAEMRVVLNKIPESKVNVSNESTKGILGILILDKSLDF